MFAFVWFWITVCGVVYCGFEYILPTIYPENPSAVFYNKCVCYVILIELVVNWLFLKFVQSPFKVDKYKQFIDKHQEDIQNSGFEINMNDIKRDSNNTGSFIVPRTLFKDSMLNKNSLKTLYVVDMDHTNNENDSASSKNKNGSLPSENQNGILLENSSPRRQRKLVYPYWSWKPCIVCQCVRPPRTHHCPICGTCVLKRDHHCFFTGSCVGLRNQRYFAVFTFWGAMATVYCVIQSLIYFFTVHISISNHHWTDIILPVAMLKWVLGYIKTFDLCLLILLYSVSWFCLTSVGFLREQINCIRRGITSFEQDTDIKITNTNDQAHNLRAVFGNYWYLSFLLPLHWVFPSLEDGVEWPHIKT